MSKCVFGNKQRMEEKSHNLKQSRLKGEIMVFFDLKKSLHYYIVDKREVKLYMQFLLLNNVYHMDFSS